MIASMPYRIGSAHPVTHNGGFINLSSGSLLNRITACATRWWAGRDEADLAEPA
jgi:hypothetical protein